MQEVREEFLPLYHEPHISSPLRNPSSQSSDNMMPLPDSVIFSSPAWDPLSETPTMTPELDHIRPNIELGQQLAMQCSHVTCPLLDPQLVSKQFKVADGRNFKQKEIVVIISLVSGELSIQHNKYKTSEALSLK
jgi:hypothetical protein